MDMFHNLLISTVLISSFHVSSGWIEYKKNHVESNDVYSEELNEIATFYKNNKLKYYHLKNLHYERGILKVKFFPSPPSTDKIIIGQGYPCEVHEVVTEDGYILTVFRIPYGRKRKPNVGRPPLLLQHGLLVNSDCWVLTDSSKALAFRLADEGYDVWINNNRGTTYSQKHTTLSIKDPKYWNFSIHELGTKDLPAVIDYMLNTTGYNNLTYVGHSQGTTLFFILTSTLPEYNDRIVVMSALAPVVFLDHSKGFFKIIVLSSKLLKKIASLFRIYDIMDRPKLSRIIGHLLCFPNSIFAPICKNLIFSITGFDSSQFNKTLMVKLFDYFPAGCAIKQLEQFSQFKNGQFNWFDYGPEGNMREYHSLIPPQYNLSVISAPVALHYSMNDYIATSQDKAIMNQGYPCEVHEIVTEDGYILTVFRIPFGKKGIQNKVGRPPLLLQHGILCNSDCWTLGDPSKALAFRLADEGYDVWINNNRGTTYSKKHKTLSTKDIEYWNFSVHEIGTKDLPAVIDYMLNNTGYEKLTYVGHSQGTTQFFILTSTLPEYNDKILVMSALAPVAFLDDMRGLVKFLSHFTKILTKLAHLMGFYDFFDRPGFIHILNHLMCGPNSIILPVCEYWFFVIVGFDSAQLDKNLVGVISDYCPAGCSIKQLEHFSQFTEGKFTWFDYGPEDNLKLYNSVEPPQYNLSLISAPVSLHYAMNDYIATVKEVKRLYWFLPNLVGLFRVPYKDFSHTDFMWATDINKLLYNKVIDIIKQFL